MLNVFIDFQPKILVGLPRVLRVMGIPAGRVGSGNTLLATGRVG